MDHQGMPEHPVARKAHMCAWCGERIQRGERYAKQFVVCEGDAWTKKLHIECEAAEQAYDFDGDVHYYHGQMARGHNHEHNWDTPEACAAAGCPGCKLSLQKAGP